MKHAKRAAMFSALPLFFIILIIVSVCCAGSSSAAGGVDYSIPLSEAVKAYRDEVTTACEKYGITDYINYILAIMMVESGGEGNDVMQSSESLGLSPGSLSPSESIDQGCKVFAEHLEACKNSGCDFLTAVQAYNYGGGFISYVAENGGKYTFELAMGFAREKSGGETWSYVNAISEPYGGWMYSFGNMFYVKLVQQYLPTSSSLVSLAKSFVGEGHSRFTSYSSKNGSGSEADWCGYFVSYCCDNLGYIDKGYIFWYANVQVAVDRMRAVNQFNYSAFYDGSYQPKPGDIIFFCVDGDVNNVTHTGIVSEASVDSVSTIEGNSGTSSTSPYWQGSSVTENTYNIYNSKILGYYPLSQFVLGDVGN